MTINKKHKFKTLKYAGNFKIIDSFETLYSLNHEAKETSSEEVQCLKALSTEEFERLCFDILLYRSSARLRRQIDISLMLLVDTFYEQLRDKILRLEGPFRVEREKINQLIKKEFSTTQSSFSRIFAKMNTLDLENIDLRKAYDWISNIEKEVHGENYRRWSSSFRKELSVDLYQATDVIEKLFVIRFGKNDGKKRNKIFIEDYLLGNLELSNFLRFGKSKNEYMTFKDFSDIRRRALRRIKMVGDNKARE